MKVRLLKDIMQNGQIKTTIKPRKRKVIGWFKDTVINASDDTGAKLIATGDAELYVEPAKPVEA